MKGINNVVLIALSLIFCVGCDKDYKLVKSDDNRVSFDVRVSGVAEQAQTKGTLIDDNSSSSITSFKLISWKGSDLFYPATAGTSAEIEYKDSKWQPSSGNSPEWPASEDVTFFTAANLPSSGASWTSVSSSSASLTYTVPQNASAQNDILLGGYKGQGETVNNTNGVAEIHFCHPLTALVLKKGEFADVTSITFKSISIQGVYSSGTVTQSFNAQKEVSFSWNTSESTTQTVTLVSASGLTVGTDDVIGEPFLLIPQDLSSASITITVEAQINGTTDVTYGKTLNSGEWQAGKINTYTLGNEA